MAQVERGDVALVTGASSGIGAGFADRLARRGYDLVLVARRADLLEEQARRLGAAHGVKVDVLPADLAEPSDLGRVERRLESEARLALLVNNAGVGGISPFSSMDETAIARMIVLNVLALTQLTRAALPRLLERRGAVINVSSGAAFAAMNGAAVYGATKAYVAQFSRVLHEEVAKDGVKVQALIPGLTRTNLGGVDSSFFDQFPAEWVMTPEDLADASLAGLEMGELVCIPGLKSADDWTRLDEGLQALGMSVSSDRPAERYGLG